MAHLTDRNLAIMRMKLKKPLHLYPTKQKPVKATKRWTRTRLKPSLLFPQHLSQMPQT
jgi:hypothetical protein